MTYVSDYKKLMELDNLFEYLVYISEKYPTNQAVQMLKGGKVYSHSYKELIKDVKKAGNYLINNGCHKQYISIIGNFCYEWMVAFFALLYANNIVVPIDYGQSGERIARLIEKADAKIVVTQRKILSGSRDIASDLKSYRIIYFDDLENVISSEESVNIESRYDSPTLDSPAMIMYTSGTTGFSKGILLSHRNILHNAIATVSRFGERAFPPGRTTLALLPPFHMFFISAGVFDTIYYGESLCYSENSLKDIELLIKTFKPTGLIIVPQIVDGIHKKIWATAKKSGKQNILKIALKVSNLLRKVKIDLRSVLFRIITDTLGGNLHTIICGGAAVNEQTVNDMAGFGIKVLVGYGVNECASIVSVNPPEKQKKGSIGMPIPEPFCKVKVENGEIMISGSIVMSGYYKDPEGTAEVFDGEWFKTGDIGRIDKDGYLYITGRKKNLIILSDGNNISPEEIESRICQSPIADSALLYVDESARTPALHVAVYPDYQYCAANAITDIKTELNNLLNQVNTENPNYMKITEVKIRETPFEKTAIGKIKRYLYTEAEVE